MKRCCAIFFLLWSGFLGSNAGWAEESPADDTYLATVGSDGVQHVRLLEVVQSGFPCSLP